MERQHFIDQLKAVSIFLIIYGHNDHSSIFSDYLTTVRLPLFFIISGFLSKGKNNVPLLAYLEKMFRRLLIPYFLISLFLYLFFILIQTDLTPEGVEYKPLKLFIGIFYAQGGEEYMAWGIPMWYLPAIFCVAMIDFMISKLPFNVRFIPVIILPFLGIALYRIIGFHLPWSLDNAMVFFPFYFFGRVIRHIVILKYIKGKELMLVLIFFMINIIGSTFNNPVNYYYGLWGNLPLMYFNGISGFLCFFALFTILPSYKAFTWIGRNTLPLLAFHTLALSIIQGIMYYLFNIRLEFTVMWSFIYTIAQIIMLIPLIFIINKYLPFVIGVSKKQKPTALIAINQCPVNRGDEIKK